MGVGTKIKMLRLAKGWSQRELARRAGISQPSLSYIEEKDPTGSKALPQLAEALGVNPEDLLSSGPAKVRHEDEVVTVGVPAENVLSIEIPEYNIAFSDGDGSYIAEVAPDSTPRTYSLALFQKRHINPEH